MFYVTLNSTNLLSKKFFEKEIKSKFSKFAKYKPYKENKKIHQEEEVCIKNSVLIFLVGRKLMILKEKWSKWLLEESIDLEKMAEFKKAM